MWRLLLASLVAAALPGAAGAWAQAAGSGTRQAQAPATQASPIQAASTQAREAAERAREAAAEEERLAGLRVRAAAALQRTEAEVSARAAQVSALAERRTATAARLARHAEVLAPLLPLMQRLALFPAETLLAIPGPPEQALRGLGVLRGVAQRLEAEAQALRTEQGALAADQQALDEALPGLRAVEADQSAQARALDEQILAARQARRQAEDAGVEAQQRAAAEAARTDNLRAAVVSLEAARARAEQQARDDALRAERDRREVAAGEARRREAAVARPNGAAVERPGHLVPPVAGTVVRGWGDQTDAGPATGVSYRPAPQARVVAPCAGRVRFSGPFRSYGPLVILDCGGGYAFVLAGLARLDVAVGAAVLAGEPVGAMPGWDATSAAARPALYVELRHDGQAVNPAPFLNGRG